MLEDHANAKVWKNSELFDGWLWGKLTESFDASEFELLRLAFSFKDETADPVFRSVADPQPDEKAKPVDLNRRGLWFDDVEKQWVEFVADADLRDFENVPLKVKIEDYFDREVRPFVTDAWISGEPKVGYEIPFTRHFYQYDEPRKLADIQKEVDQLEDEIKGMLKEVMG